jgi:pyruvate dehydrogenase E2 component (dihydrolipoamide acetyltransferase)
MMQKPKVPALLATLLYTCLASAQAPAPSQAPAAPAPAQNPNPGQGGVAPGDYPTRPALTPEQQADQVKRQAERVIDMQAAAFGRQMRLRPDQLAKLHPILVERQKELSAIATAAENMSPEQRSKAMQIQTETQTKIKGILDPQQRAQYEHLIELRNSQASRRSAMAAARRAQMRQNAPSADSTPATPETSPAAPAPTAPDAAPAPDTSAPAPAAPPAPQAN